MCHNLTSNTDLFLIVLKRDLLELDASSLDFVGDFNSKPDRWSQLCYLS